MPNRRLTNRKATYDEWLCANEEYILDIFMCIQEMNASTGRRVFNRESCTFPAFCRLAYEHSHIYAQNDAWMYHDDDSDDDSQLHTDSI